MKSILFILILSVLSLNIKAQEAKDDSSSAKLSDIISPSIVNISGEAGFSGELYSISGRDARRPGASGRVFIRPTLTLFNNFSVNFDIFLSTEGSSASLIMLHRFYFVFQVTRLGFCVPLANLD